MGLIRRLVAPAVPLLIVSTSFAQPPAELIRPERAWGISSAAIEEGRVTAVEGNRSVRVTAENFAERAAAGALFVERSRAGPTDTALPSTLLQPGEETAVRLSYEITATSAATRQPVRLDAWVLDSTGLLLNGALAAYTGMFKVALTNAEDPADRSPLGSPVPVAVTATGASSIEPRPLEIRNLTAWHDVTIVVPDVQGTTYPVSVSVDPGSAGDRIELSVSQPAARIWATPASIVGWGIGEATINLQVSGLNTPENYRVPLHSTHGSLESGTVTLDASGHATTKLRSSADHMAMVTIPGTALQSEPLEIAFDAPWWFLGAALFGGLAGAFVRGRGREHWAMALTIGIVSALIMTLAYAVGIDWPARVLDTVGLPASSEAAVFVLGAVGALLGVSALVPGAQPKPATAGA